MFFKQLVKISIPKNGARQIVVGDIIFRWLIQKKPTYTQSDYGIGKLHVAVELEENPGTSLFICSNRKHPNDIETEIANPIKPSDFSNSIKRAMRLGWNPSKNGIPFSAKIVDETI